MINTLRANAGDMGSIPGSGRFPGNLPRLGKSFRWRTWRNRCEKVMKGNKISE